MNKPLPPAILLMGPTACGKTELALGLVERLPLAIVSVDSAQIYRDMDIGSAKPSRETLCRFPHSLIDILSPEERYSAASFHSDALREMAKVCASGRIPLLVGGTMLYFRALIEGLAELPSADTELRLSIEKEAKERGWPAMHAELTRVDPQTALRLSPNDQQRLQRALEVYRLSGQPMSRLLANSQQQPLPYRVLQLSLLPSERPVLHERIAHRFRNMLDKGLVGEVRGLRDRYRLHAELPSMRCVGYRQAWQYLEGELPANELCERGIFATRQLAKRQIAWLTHSIKATSYDCLRAETAEVLYAKVDSFIQEAA